jgi:hypothetical protein
MEKAFAGMGGSGSTDGGTSQRVFGNFLSWMSLCKAQHNCIYVEQVVMWSWAPAGL